MTTLRQSYEAAKYHKKLTAAFSTLFGISLLALTFASQLLSTQTTTLDSISVTINDMKKTFPQVGRDLGDTFSKNNHNLVLTYQHFYIFLLFLTFFIFLFFGYLSAKFRKREIKSFFNMGISKLTMIKYLLLELLIPILVSCFVTALLFIVAQQQIINLSFSTNHFILAHYLDETQKNQTTPKNEIQTTKHSLIESVESDKVLVPYNKRSAFDVTAKKQPTGKSFLSFIKSMLRLVSVTLSGSLVGFYSYTVLNFRRRRLFTS